MDLAWLVEAVGDGVAPIIGGLVVGLLFGAAAQRSRFCLRSAAIEFARGRFGPRLSIWLLAFSSAVVGTQLLVATDRLDLGSVRQLTGSGSLSGAALGGAMFGIGMVLARGCSSRLLVLSANGNLRALLSGLVFAVTAQASLRGSLSPLREGLAGAWTVSEAEILNLITALGLRSDAGLALGAVFLLVAVIFAIRSRLTLTGWAGATGVGVAVVMGWWVTHGLAQASFDVVSVKSMSFTGPSADLLMLVLSPQTSGMDFDTGLMPGVFLGSFLAAAFARELKLEGFEGGASMRRYIIGAILMGFGGMLAGGCAVGAGVTGGAVFALTAWITLFAMWGAAMLTDLLVDRDMPVPAGRLAPAP